jgi:hypothetical protein
MYEYSKFKFNSNHIRINEINKIDIKYNYFYCVYYKSILLALSRTFRPKNVIIRL